MSDPLKSDRGFHAEPREWFSSARVPVLTFSMTDPTMLIHKRTNRCAIAEPHRDDQCKELTDE